MGCEGCYEADEREKEGISKRYVMLVNIMEYILFT